MEKSCARTADCDSPAAGGWSFQHEEVARVLQGFLFVFQRSHLFQRWRSEKLHHGVKMTSQVSRIKTHQHLFSSRGLSEIDLKWQLQLSQLLWEVSPFCLQHCFSLTEGVCCWRCFFPHRCDSRLQVLNYRSTLFLYVHQSSSPESSACNYRHTEAPSVSLVFNVGGKKIFKVVFKISLTSCGALSGPILLFVNFLWCILFQWMFILNM